MLVVISYLNIAAVQMQLLGASAAFTMQPVAPLLLMMMMMMTRVMENLFTRKSDQKVLSPFTSITVANYSLWSSEKSSAINADF